MILGHSKRDREGGRYREMEQDKRKRLEKKKETSARSKN